MSATLVGHSTARQEATFRLPDGLSFLLDEYRLTLRTNGLDTTNFSSGPTYTTWVGNFSLRLTHSNQHSYFQPGQTGQFCLRFEGGNVSTLPIYLESCNFQADLFPEEGIHYGRMCCDFISCGDARVTSPSERASPPRLSIPIRVPPELIPSPTESAAIDAYRDSMSLAITQAIDRNILYGEIPSPVGTANPSPLPSHQHNLSERMREAAQRQQDRMVELIDSYRNGLITQNELRRQLGLHSLPVPAMPLPPQRRAGLTSVPAKPRKPLPSRRRIQLPAGGITLDEE